MIPDRDPLMRFVEKGTAAAAAAQAAIEAAGGPADTGLPRLARYAEQLVEVIREGGSLGQILSAVAVLLDAIAAAPPPSTSLADDVAALRGTTADQWICPAYGPEGVAIGAVCFFSGELGGRSCVSEAMCRACLRVERKRIFQRIHELAEAGDDTGKYLAATITDPSQLLGGEATP